MTIAGECLRVTKRSNPSFRLREMKIDNINNPAPANIKVNSVKNKHADLFTVVNLMLTY